MRPPAAAAAVPAPRERPLPHRGRRWFAPPDLAVWVVAAAAFFLALLMLRTTVDDAFWQVAYGRWMLAHHALPRRDAWSWTMAGRPVMVTEWLFDLAMAAAAAAGPWASLLLAWSGILALGWCGLALYTRLGRHRPVAGLLALALLVLVAPFEALLPQEASFALFAAVWLALERARGHGARPLAWLPPLFWLWANVHGSFYLGLALVALDALLAGLRPRLGRLTVRYRARTRRALPWALAASALATLLNPYGWRLYAHEAALATSSFHLKYIAEFASPDFHNPYLEWVVLPALLAAFGLGAGTRRALPARELVATLGLLAAAFVAVRVLPYALVGVVGLAAAALRTRRVPAKPARWHLAGLAAAVAVVAAVRWPPVAWPTAAGYPAHAAGWVQAHRADLSGHGFDTYEWGGYLLWRWNGRPRVYVDSRGDFYDTGPVLDRYVAVMQLSVDPGPYLQGQGVGWALLPSASPVAGALRRDGWRPLYADRTAVVLAAPPRPGAGRRPPTRDAGRTRPG